MQSATPEIYYYRGGELTNYPALLPPLLSPLFNVKRGQAFWIRSGTVFNRYFGPFELVNSGLNGVHFGTDSASSVVLGGTPVFFGTRVPFQNRIDYLEAGDSIDLLLYDFPTVSRELVIAALDVAKEKLHLGLFQVAAQEGKQLLP